MIMAEKKEKNLQDSLIEIQKKLKAPKGQYNSFGKYRYRSCEDILEAVKPLLAAEGVLLTLTDEIVVLGNRFYLKATATVRKGDAEVSNASYAREDDTKKGMDGSQITGTASSYARKYALNGLFLIDDTKDADTDEHHNQQANAPKQPDPKPYADIDFEAELLAEAEANKCGTVAELADVYNKYAKMNPAYVREGSVFMKALSARKKTIQSQPKTTLF